MIMKVRAHIILNDRGYTCDSRSFWLMGTIENPMMSTIYEQEKTAKEWSKSDLEEIQAKLGDSFIVEYTR